MGWRWEAEEEDFRVWGNKESESEFHEKNEHVGKSRTSSIAAEHSVRGRQSSFSESVEEECQGKQEGGKEEKHNSILERPLKSLPEFGS